MSALNEIAENIAYKLGDQYNHTLKESIKHTLVNYRAKFIRDDIEKNGLNINTYYQTIVLNFEKVNKLDDVGADLTCLNSLCSSAKYNEKYMILKSKQKLPSLIKLKSLGNTPFKYIGSVDRMVRFKQGEPDTIQYFTDLPYQKTPIRYYISNNYVYLLNTTSICDLLIEGIFDDPRQAFELCKGDKFKDDNDFPISNDLLFYIEKGIVTGEYPLLSQTDEEEINIKPDDKG